MLRGQPDRRSQSQRRHHQRLAFSLIELLVALSMLVIVLAGVYGVFATTSHSLRTVEQESELGQSARVILGDLRNLLGSIYPMRVPVSDEDRQKLGSDTNIPAEGVISFAGEHSEDEQGRPQDNLRFTAVVGGLNEGGNGRFDLAELIYQLDTDDSTPEVGLVRKRGDHPGLVTDPPEEPTVAELTPLATSFGVRYFVGDQLDQSALATATEDQLWTNQWSDPNLAPSAIEVRLGLTPKNRGATERVYRMVMTIPIREPRADPRKNNKKQAANGAGNSSGAANDAADALPNLTPSLPGTGTATTPGGGTGTTGTTRGPARRGGPRAHR